MTTSKALEALRKRHTLLKGRPKLNTPKLPLTLDPRFTVQNAFVDSTNRYIAAQCSRRAGKSSGLALRFFKALERYPKSTCIYLSLTFDSAKSIMWPVLQELNDKFNLGCTFLEGKMVMTHPNGAKLRLYGADQKNFVKRLKGQKAPAIAIDEAQDFGNHLQSLIDDVLTPMLVDYADSWLAVTGTPGPIPKGYFFDLTQNGKHGYECHYWTLNENPYLPNSESFVQDLIVKKQWKPDNPTLLREWRNKWVKDPNSLWVQYNEEACHYIELPGGVNKWNYICAVDLGFLDADAIAVLAWSDENPYIYLVEEIITEKQGLTPLVNQIRDVIVRYSPYKIVGDSGGGGAKMMEEMRLQFHIPIEAAIKQEKQQTVEFMNDALRMGTFKAKRDSQFVEDSYQVQIDYDKSTPDRLVIKKTFHSDIIDAVIYAFRHSPFYTYEPVKEAPKRNTAAYDKEREQAIYDHHVEKLRKAKENKDNQGMNWETDVNGVPSWLKYGDD